MFVYVRIDLKVINVGKCMLFSWGETKWNNKFRKTNRYKMETCS